MGLFIRFKSPLMQYNAHFVNCDSIQSKIDDKARYDLQCGYEYIDLGSTNDVW